MSSSKHVDACHERLVKAVRAGRRTPTCHRYWSKFIRVRDENECLICGGLKRLAAHHVVRQSFLKEAQYHTGNGATLCIDCHGEAHVGYNGPPDLSLPVDTQGREKLETVAELFRLLAKRSAERHPNREEFYYLSRSVLSKFKLMQGFDPTREIAAPLYNKLGIYGIVRLLILSKL